MKLREFLNRARTETIVEIRIENMFCCIVNTHRRYEDVITESILDLEINDWFVIAGKEICVDLKTEGESDKNE